MIITCVFFTFSAIDYEYILQSPIMIIWPFEMFQIAKSVLNLLTVSADRLLMHVQLFTSLSPIMLNINHRYRPQKKRRKTSSSSNQNPAEALSQSDCIESGQSSAAADVSQVAESPRSLQGSGDTNDEPGNNSSS